MNQIFQHYIGERHLGRTEGRETEKCSKVSRVSTFSANTAVTNIS